MSDSPISPLPLPLRYFTPDEVILLIEHQDDLTASDIAKAMNNNALIYESKLVNPNVDPGKVLTFTFANKYTSREKRTLEKLPAKDKVINQKLENRNSVSVVFVDVKPKETNIVQAIDQLQINIKQFTIKNELGQLDNRLSVVTSAPNWLLSATPNQGGTGGPGARPIRPTQIPPPGAGKPESREDKQEVHVAILDTAPTQNALDDTYRRLGGKHALLDSLYPHLRIWDAITLGIDLPPVTGPVSYGLRDHHYEMSDHGLFVAGIIHQQAPNVKLHLVQVLNDYGVGSVKSILQGLYRLRQGQNGKTPLKDNNPFVTNLPLVINMSLMLDEPRLPITIDGTEFPGHSREEMPTWDNLNDSDYLEHMGWPLEIIMEWLLDEDHRGGAQVVAAAGNDGGYLAKSRYVARYPAAFKSVTGVAALDILQNVATYSNLADDPTSEGLAAFGGDIDRANPIYADPDKAVLGVYIGKFPDGTASSDGWARWAGTSFAAPYLTGKLAQTLGGGVSTSDTALNNIKRDSINRATASGKPSATPAGEITI